MENMIAFVIGNICDSIDRMECTDTLYYREKSHLNALLLCFSLFLCRVSEKVGIGLYVAQISRIQVSSYFL